MKALKMVSILLLLVLCASVVLAQGDICSNAEIRHQLAITAHNLNSLGQAAHYAKTPGRLQQISEQVESEIKATNKLLVGGKFVRQELTSSQLLILLRKLGYWGGATWGKRRVDRALREKILLGRAYGTTVNSKEWRTWTTREEFATGLMRTLDSSRRYTDKAIGSLNQNPNARQPARKAYKPQITMTDWWKIGLAALALLAIIAILMLLRRRRRAHCAAASGPATPATVVPFGPGAGSSVSATPTVGSSSPYRNGSGIQHVPS